MSADETPGHHERAAETHERAAGTHNRAADLHEEAANLHEAHAAEMRDIGAMNSVARAERLADEERELAEKERVAADREDALGRQARIDDGAA
jgi:hypothetical protein